MKKIFLYVLYVVVCGAVITGAIVAGNNHSNCHECQTMFTYSGK